VDKTHVVIVRARFGGLKLAARLSESLAEEVCVTLIDKNEAFSFGYELGAVPPFGGAAGYQVIVERRLAECEVVVLEAGSHSELLRLRTADLLAVTGAAVADLAAGVGGAPYRSASRLRKNPTR
jgi:prolyl-tRNA editing enzyme YbaK/EbsC (Cys-tRNA(Pro) deacylase)